MAETLAQVAAEHPHPEWWDTAGRCTECWYWAPNHMHFCSRSFLRKA